MLFFKCCLTGYDPRCASLIHACVPLLRHCVSVHACVLGVCASPVPGALAVGSVALRKSRRHTAARHMLARHGARVVLPPSRHDGFAVGDLLPRLVAISTVDSRWRARRATPINHVLLDGLLRRSCLCNAECCARGPYRVVPMPPRSKDWQPRRAFTATASRVSAPAPSAPRL